MTGHCDCDFYEKSPKAHDMLVGIEDMDPAYAAKLVVDLLSHEEIHVGNEPALIGRSRRFLKIRCSTQLEGPPVGMFHMSTSADTACNLGWLQWPDLLDRLSEVAS